MLAVAVLHENAKLIDQNTGWIWRLIHLTLSYLQVFQHSPQTLRAVFHFNNSESTLRLIVLAQARLPVTYGNLA